MPTPDLVAEHRALEIADATLRKLYMDEWMTMPAQVARSRRQRILDIRNRLRAIERTAAWKYRS